MMWRGDEQWWLEMMSDSTSKLPTGRCAWKASIASAIESLSVYIYSPPSKCPFVVLLYPFHVLDDRLLFPDAADKSHIGYLEALYATDFQQTGAIAL